MDILLHSARTPSVQALFGEKKIIYYMLSTYCQECGHKNEYMQYTCNAKHDYKSVIHVDGTSRCQVVKKDCQSVIRPILEEYFERTGIPMLLNTSLNIKGQPILNDERDVEEWEKKYKVRIF